MTKYPPKRLAGLLPMPRLPEGHATEAMRVSGPADVLVWAASLTPAQRGQVFKAAREQQQRSEGATSQTGQATGQTTAGQLQQQPEAPSERITPAPVKPRTLTPSKWRK